MISLSGTEPKAKGSEITRMGLHVSELSENQRFFRALVMAT